MSSGLDFGVIGQNWANSQVWGQCKLEIVRLHLGLPWLGPRLVKQIFLGQWLWWDRVLVRVLITARAGSVVLCKVG